MDIKELKAKAYDLLAQLQAIQQELQATNQKIAEESSKPPTEKAE